jgi:hypothetical protein
MHSYVRHTLDTVFSIGQTRRARWRVALGVALAAGSLLALVACSPSSSTRGTATPTATTPGNPGATATATAPGPYPVLVYFSRHPDSDSNPNAVFAVNRLSPTLGVATYAIQQLLAGPQSQEQSAGYYTDFAGALSGSSNCGGADFTITLDKRGSVPEPGTATLQFCRAVGIPGELAGGRMVAEVNATLRQFSNIQKNIILNQNGHCFNDLQGGDTCLGIAP